MVARTKEIDGVENRTRTAGENLLRKYKIQFPGHVEKEVGFAGREAPSPEQFIKINCHFSHQEVHE